MVNILMSRGLLDKPDFYLYFKEFIKPKMKVCIIPWAFDGRDDYSIYRVGGSYYERMVFQFLPYQILEENITFLDYYLDDEKTCQEKVKEADVIYFTGGLPDKLYERLAEFNLLKLLTITPKVIVGSSAGAVIQFKDYHLSPDRDYKKFQTYQGLDIITDFGIEVHYKHKFRQKKSLKKMYQKINRPYYTIPDDGAIIVSDGKIIPIGNVKRFKF